MKISKEAVEAAAKAAYIADNLGWDGAEAAWDDMGGSERSFERAGWEIAARAALEAAAPLLMAQALREMAETFDPLDTDPIKSWHPHDVAELLRWRAADITTPKEQS